MPWLAPVKPPRRGWLERSLAATEAEAAAEGEEEEAKKAGEELRAIEELEREMGMGEEGPVMFVARLGEATAALANVTWLQPPPAEALAVPEKEEERAFVYRAPGWAAAWTAAFRRRIQPFPLFRAVPKNCVVVGSVKGDDLNLVAEDGPPSLAKLFQVCVVCVVCLSAVGFRWVIIIYIDVDQPQHTTKHNRSPPSGGWSPCRPW